MANDNTQFFIKELAFEQALANLLHTSHGWDGGIMMNPTEEDLVQSVIIQQMQIAVARRYI